MFRTSRYQNFSISQIFQYTKQKVLCNFHKDSTHSGFLVAWQTLLHKRDVVGQCETQLKTIIVVVYNGNILGGILLPVPRRYDYRVSVVASLDKLYSRATILDMRILVDGVRKIHADVSRENMLSARVSRTRASEIVPPSRIHFAHH